MSGSCTTTPGYLLANGEAITEAKLRLIAAPTIRVNAGQITGTELDIGATRTALGVLGTNALQNGTFAAYSAHPQQTYTLYTGSPGNFTDSWFANAVGAGSINLLPSATVRTGALSLWALQIQAGVTVTEIDVFQNLPGSIAAQLARPITFSAWIYNSAAVPITAALILATANASSNFSAVTTQATTASTSVPAITWTQLTWTVDASAFTNLANGLQVMLKLTGAPVGTAGVTFNLAELKLEPGPNATPVDLDHSRTLNQGALVAAARNLLVVASGTVATVTADELVLRSYSEGTGFDRGAMTVPVNTTASTALSGAGGLDTGSIASSTWYYLWVISDGRRIDAVFSTSAILPTMPGGYSYRALVAAIYRNSSPALVATTYRDRRAAVIQQNLINNKAGSGDGVWITEALAAFVPPIARRIYGQAGSSVISEGAQIRLGSNAASPPSSEAVIVAAALGSTPVNGWYACGQFSILFPGAATSLFWYAPDTVARNKIDITGWEI